VIALASDHIGVKLKNEIKSMLDHMGLEYIDYGTYTEERTDYPIFSARAAKAVANGECERGILICGTGVGISIAANKVKGIRTVVCSDCYYAKLSREHNNTNILAMGARVVGVDLAKLIAEIWLTTDYEGGRHQKRVEMITALENGLDIE
jgi:ribose 5-phosphate isomerase B